jgi:ABC-type glycerol-3-phosphate transport system substrate-binding protein
MPRDVYGAGGWFYNKGLFDTAGLPYPEFGWTWKQVLEVVPKLTDRPNRQYGYAIDIPMTPREHGFSPVTADGKEVVGHFDSPTAIKGFKIYKAVYDAGSPTVDQLNTECQDVMGGGAGPVGAFLSGRTAVAGMDAGGHSLATQAGIDWGFVNNAWPDDPADRHQPSLFYVLWGININTQNPEGSWDFLKWVTAKDEGITIMAKAGYFVPFREPMEKAGYPQEILDVRFAPSPPEWKEPLPILWAVPCFDEAGVPEWRSTSEKVLASSPDETEQIVHDGAVRAQTAVDACWAKFEAGQ